MRSARWLVLLLPLLAPAPLPSADKPADPPVPVGYHTVTIGKHNFTLPKGFTIELVAESPQVEHPIIASFDDKGRLFVADSSGSNAKPADQLKTPTNRVVMLEADKDGKFTKSTVFADKLPFLEGCLAHGGSVYVATAPTITKLTDTDGDGVADKRETWFDGGTLTGCANDVHGPYDGPDGRLYWTKGGFAEQKLTLGNGKKFVTRAAHIYSAKEDGSDLRVEMTGGMDNPVKVEFNSSGEMFFTTTFLQHPANGKRDGIIHATYGAVYGKDHDPVQEQIRTRPELSEPMTHLGPAAPAGLVRYSSKHFGEEYDDNFFCAQFNMAKVSRHILKEKGSTYETTDSDFVVSDNRDFHPTDVLVDRDGSLLIVDTGGWYKLCCPSSVMEKRDVLGAIYRVRQEQQKYVARPAHKPRDWKKLSTDDLVYGVLRTDSERLRFSDWTLFAELATRGKEAVEGMTALLKDPNADNEHTWHIVLAVAEGIGSAEARGLAREVLEHFRPRTDGQKAPTLDDEATNRVRLSAIRTLGRMRDKEAVPALVKQLESKSPLVRRVAAESLGHIGDAKAVPDLLTALADEKNDTTLDTALTRALIDLDNPKAVAEGLKHESDRVKRAALAAVAETSNSFLKAADVVPHLVSKDADLSETAWWIATRHPEWEREVADALTERWKNLREWSPQADRTATLVARWPAVQTLLADVVAGRTPSHRPVVLGLIGVMARAAGKSPPAEWYEALRTGIHSNQEECNKAKLRTLGAWPAEKAYPDDWRDELLCLGNGWGRFAKPDDETRLLALAAIPGGLKAEEPSLTARKATTADLIDFARQTLAASNPAATRSVAAEVLAKADLSANQFVNIAEAIPSASPLDFDRLLAVFTKRTDEAVGLALVKALSEPKVRAAVRAEQVKPILDKYPKGVQAEAEKLYKQLDADRAEQTKKLDTVLKDTKPGDVRRGQAVFNTAKAACTSCHKVAYVGGQIGPDLTKVGSIRSERDLLESIVFPSASFVRSYEPVRVDTKDGKSFNGILKADRPDEVVLTVSATEEVRIARKDIDEMKPGTVSVMPAGLDQQLTPQELADLVAFLRSLK